MFTNRSQQMDICHLLLVSSFLLYLFPYLPCNSHETVPLTLIKSLSYDICHQSDRGNADSSDWAVNRSLVSVDKNTMSSYKLSKSRILWQIQCPPKVLAGHTQIQ